MPRPNYYDEVELEDMSYDEERDLFHYPCPCGDRFEITRQQLREAEDVARCPSCSLLIRVVFDPVRVSCRGHFAQYSDDLIQLDFEDDEDEAVAEPAEQVTLPQAV